MIYFSLISCPNYMAISKISIKHVIFSYHNSIAITGGYCYRYAFCLQSWKRRFFVASHTTLKYYVEKGDAEPKGVIDLNECSECQPDTTQGFDYCFG